MQHTIITDQAHAIVAEDGAIEPKLRGIAPGEDIDQGGPVVRTVGFIADHGDPHGRTGVAEQTLDEAVRRHPAPTTRMSLGGDVVSFMLLLSTGRLSSWRR